MDKRLELNAKQKEIVARYNAIVKEMEEAKIICTCMEYEGITAINGEHVADQFFPEDDSDDMVWVDFWDGESIEIPFGMHIWNEDGGFKVAFN